MRRPLASRDRRSKLTRLKFSDFILIFYLISDTTGSDEGSVGEVSIQVDLFTHPGTGEHKVTVKGIYTLSIFDL